MIFLSIFKVRTIPVEEAFMDFALLDLMLVEKLVPNIGSYDQILKHGQLYIQNGGEIQ